MDCENAHDLITRSISGNASAADEAELQRHFASCPTCAEMRSRLGKVWDLTGRAPRVALSDEQTRAVAGRVRRSGAPARPQPMPAAHRRWAAAGLAAALLVGFAVYFSLPESRVPESPDRVGDATPPASTPVVKTQPESPEVPPGLTIIEKVLDQLAEDEPKSEAPPKVEPEKPEVKVADAPRPETPEVESKPEPKPARVAKAVQEPKPAPAEPKPEPEKTPVPTVPTIASLARADGPVFVIRNGIKTPAEAGLKLNPGHGIETRGEESQAVIEFPDASRLVMGGDTTIESITDAEGKRVTLGLGILACDVTRQPKGQEMVFHTPHADARVLGTRLTLTVNASTLLEVHKGRVRLVDRGNAKSVEVSSGRFAVAGKAATLSARKITRARIALSDPFSGSRWSQIWSQRQESGTSPRFKVGSGYLSLPFPEFSPDEASPAGVAPTPGTPLPPGVGQKVMDAVLGGSGIGSRSDWPRASWLETRKAFPLVKDAPLRIRVKLWQSHSDDKRTSWICLNRRVAKDRMALERRGDTLQLWSGGGKTSLWKAGRPSVKKNETLEIWLTRTQVVVRRNGETLHVGPNPLTSRAVQVSLGGGAKADLAQDEEIRFDDVEVAWLSQADLARILK